MNTSISYTPQIAIEGLKTAARRDERVGDALLDLRMAQDRGVPSHVDEAYRRLDEAIPAYVGSRLVYSRVDATIVSRSLP